MIPNEATAQHRQADIEQHFLTLLAQLARIDERLQQRLVQLQHESQALADNQDAEQLRHAAPDWLQERQQWQAPAPLDDVESSSPLGQLVERFGLTPLERDLLLLTLLPCLDRRYHSIFSQAQGHSRLQFPTRHFALEILCPEPRMQARQLSCLLHGGALLRHGLLKLDGNTDQFGNCMLKPDPSIYSFLIGHRELPDLLAPYVSWQPASGLVSDDHAECITALERALRTTAAGVRIVFRGLRGSGRALLVVHAAQQCAMRTLLLDLAHLPHDGNEALAILKAACREAQLHDACLLLRNLDTWSKQQPHLFGKWKYTLQGFQQPLVSLQDSAATICWLDDQPHLIVEMPRRSLQQDCQLLRQHLKANATVLGKDIDLPALVQRFPVNAARLTPILQEAELYRQQRDPYGSLSQQDLHRAFRWRSQQNFGELAQRIEPRRHFADLIVTPELQRQMQELLAAVQQREHALTLGFADHDLGISALFHGTSGSGKTMAAEVLAHALGVDLIKVDLSTVVNKYIGETEKNLSTVFDLAALDSGLLFFDEADALFGKRSESKDAKDRHANIEVAYLLQRMEAHPGLVILSTNNRSHLDQAFSRRFTFMLKFGFPDLATRLKLWQAIWPPAVQLDSDVDLERLAAHVEITGANIRNIALAACWLAASADAEKIGLTHIQQALKRELAKTGKVAFG